MDGNLILQELIGGDSRLVPQFFCNPSFDDFDVFTRVKDAAVRSIRMVPQYQHYPFREWIVGPWLDWMEREGLSLWLPATYTVFENTTELDASDLYDTIREHPHLNVVLTEVPYRNLLGHSSAQSLPNLHVEISRLAIADPINRFLEFMDDSRILFGSRYPKSAMALYCITWGPPPSGPSAPAIWTSGNGIEVKNAGHPRRRFSRTPGKLGPLQHAGNTRALPEVHGQRRNRRGLPQLHLPRRLGPGQRPGRRVRPQPRFVGAAFSAPTTRKRWFPSWNDASGPWG